MKTLVLIIILLFNLELNAQVVLIPSQNTPLENYLQHCRVEGYQCSHEFLKNKIINSDTPFFQNLIENIDLQSEDYRKILSEKIRIVLNQESLSLEQVDLLIKIITKYETIEKNAKLNNIKNELKELSHDLHDLTEEKTDSETYILFKKLLSKKQYQNIKFKQKYTHTIKVTPYIEPIKTSDRNSVPLLIGDCENYQFSTTLNENKTLHFTPLFKEECSRTTLFTESDQHNRFKFEDYKKPLIYTAVGLALIGLLTQYQVQVTY